MVILGGNSGIGRATALDLARRGARVLLLCRNTEKGEIAAKSIRDQISSEVSLQNHARSQSGIKKSRTLDDGGESGTIYKPDLQVYRLDLASTRCIRECAKNIIKNESGIDILINNAGNYLIDFLTLNCSILCLGCIHTIFKCTLSNL